MFMPAGGEIIEVNPELENSPDLVNKILTQRVDDKIKLTDLQNRYTLIC
jgi:glycine cleavage system H lipoate-binding protein